MVESTDIQIHHVLIHKASNGERSAQSELYTLYYKAMYNTSLRIVGDSQVAEDILHDSFIAAFKTLSNFNYEVTFGAWLKRIVINQSINYLKKKQLIATKLNDYSLLDDQKDESIDLKSVELIKNAIQHLAPSYKVIFSLYVIEGYDHEEIAEILKITTNTSRSQLARAKKRIKQMIETQQLELA